MSIFVSPLLVAIVTVNRSLSGVDTQGFRSAPRSKRKLGSTSDSRRDRPSRPRTSLPFCHTSPTQKLLATHHNQAAIKSRIPPIVIYSYLSNHSATLKKVNEKLPTPVDVKSKSPRLLLYAKPVTDYKCAFGSSSDCQASLPYTYSLPEAVQPRLVLKRYPPNFPVDEIQADLKAPELRFVKITHPHLWAGSSVGIATELRAGRFGIESRRGRDFPPVQTGPGAHPTSCTMDTGSF